MSKLEAERKRLRDEEIRLAERLKREQELAAQSPEMSPFYGSFAQSNEQQQKQLRLLQQEVQKEIDRRKEQMAELFGDLKKLEIRQETLREEARAESDRREQIELDEIAMQSFQRGQQEEDAPDA